ncbi:MAG TPA: class I SAM-dependent methyltransferase, partial [Candidatus Saccharimonadia bacterium]|nr:class I SAM-dependent methyltransferase [Candidatus Saccharimonadia bacterium]
PTLTRQVEAALDLADLKSGQTLLELGCGDGKVVLAAAKRGVHVIGYELNPVLALIAWLRTRRHTRNVQIIWGNFWHRKLPPADAVFVFLLPKYMDKLNQKIEADRHKSVKLVTFAFTIPKREPDAVKDGVYLYFYS